MKFYKLELINREQSYNQMFGTTPTIGNGALMGGIGGKPVVMAKTNNKQLGMNAANPGMQSKKVL